MSIAETTNHALTAAAYQKRWRIEHSRGEKRIVPPGPAQGHVRDLVTNGGLTIRGIAEAAGVAAFIISELNRGIKKSLHRDTEAAILAVTPEAVLNRSNPEGFVPNIGGRRRLQALMAMGWRHQDLAPLLGLNTSNIVHQPGEWFTKSRHDAIKELYDRLWDKRGPASLVSLNRIAKAGYAPPLAWDDESIDDPKAVPATAVKPKLTDTRSYRSAAECAEDAEFLISSGEDFDAIAARLEMSPEALERALYRQHRSDLVARAKTMAERRALRYAS